MGLVESHFPRFFLREFGVSTNSTNGGIGGELVDKPWTDPRRATKSIFLQHSVAIVATTRVVAVLSRRCSVSIVFDPLTIVSNVEFLPSHVFVKALGGRSGSHFKTIHRQPWS